jgi:autotransporter-associated beta strand protein
VLTINSDRITFYQNAANANAFTGGVVITSCKLLQLFSLYGLSSAHAVEANGVLQLAVNGGTFPIGALTGSGTVRTYVGAGYNGTLSIGGDSGSGTFSGKMIDGFAGSSVLSVIKAGSGVQTLAGTNTYTGPTTVSAGTLKLGVADALTNSAISVAASATLDLGGKAQHVKALTGSGGTLQVNIAADGLGSDQVIVPGDLNLSGLALNVVGTDRMLASQKYLIASSAGGTRTGLFSSNNLGKKWMVMYLPSGAQLELRRGTLISVL